MDAIDIKYHLEKRGYQIKDIAQECDKSSAAVSNTIHGRPFKSPKVRAKIAQILEMDVSDIWPEKETVQPSP